MCLHKIFDIGSTTKVNCREFYFFILDLKCTMHITPVLLRNYSFYNFLNRSNLTFVSFQKKIFHFKKCLYRVYIYAVDNHPVGNHLGATFLGGSCPGAFVRTPFKIMIINFFQFTVMTTVCENLYKFTYQH